jgi:transcriptional repressor NrdR
MLCPHCQSDTLRVVDSRDAQAEPAIRRRRECESCGYRFTTYERVETPNVWLVKKDGRREQFDRTKLARGIWRACEKRPISETAIEGLITEIESDLRATGEAEVSSDKVGELVMTHLKSFDEIAYIRFASVYRQFADLGELHKEVTKTLQGSKLTPRKQPVKTK